ncbi:hypothetical protein MGAS10750_Spy1473 [Streptococcus pyogenes MGAS10750]|nr:hypothetical protein MGAS10750_Spy1473 [Streptococcus pyogenes MGAS10750]
MFYLVFFHIISLLLETSKRSGTTLTKSAFVGHLHSLIDDVNQNTIGDYS